MMKASDTDSINNQLVDLAIDSNQISLEDLEDGVEPSDAFVEICVALLEKLHTHDNQVGLCKIEVGITLSDIYRAIESRKPHFSEISTLLKFRLISFLCSHLQVRQEPKIESYFIVYLSQWTY